MVPWVVEVVWMFGPLELLRPHIVAHSRLRLLGNVVKGIESGICP